MTRSIYDETCKPSPLSEFPKRKPPVRMVTLNELFDLNKEFRARFAEASEPDPRNYRGANWSEVG